MSKSRLKLFLENFLFYGGLSMLTKALPFITLPIITRMLPDASSYGIADMFNLVNSFGIAIAVLGIYDAIFREFFEDKDNIQYQKKVTSTGLGIVLISSVIMFFLTILFNKKITLLLFKNLEYSNLLLLSAFAIGVGGISSIIAAPTRMRNKRKVYLYTGVGFPLIGFIATYSLIKIGYTYKAIVYSNLIMALTSLTVFYILNRKDFNLKLFDKVVAKELFKIGLPLLPTFLIYWIFNSMDRVMINRMLGPTELGIYSVGSKVASISQLFYTAFAGGFSYFKFSTMKDEDQVLMNSNLLEYLGLISFLIYLLISPFSGIIFKILFDDKYFNSSIVFNYLFLSPLILMLFQIISSQLLVVKKSLNITITLLAGAVINIVLNFYLIPLKGIEGASFSTLFSYIFSLLFIMFICKKMNLIILKWRFNFSLFLVIVLNILNIFDYKNTNYLYLISFVLIIGIYFRKIKELMDVK